MSRRLYSSVFLFFFLSISFASAYELSDFNSGTEAILDKQSNSSFASITSTVFKSETSPSFEYTVVAYTIFVVMLSMLLSMLRVIPSFGKHTFLAVVVAICCAGLMGISGSIDSMTRAVLGMSSTPEFESWSSIALFLILVILVAVAIVTSKLFTQFSKWLNKDEAELSGFKLGSDVERSKMYTSIFKQQ